MIDAIYNREVLKLAADISGMEELENPNATTSLRSPLCGSSITISISLEEKMITGYSQEVKACALGQASASVMAKAAIGKSKKDIQNAKEQIVKMLTKGEALPKGDWAPLSALAPAKDAKSRHGAILLPFEAVLKALAELKV